MRADPSLDANQNRKVVMSITARSIAVKDIGREATIFIRGDAMDRDEYLRRASALEKRAADLSILACGPRYSTQRRNIAIAPIKQWSAERTPSSSLTSTLAAQGCHSGLPTILEDLHAAPLRRDGSFPSDRRCKKEEPDGRTGDD